MFRALFILSAFAVVAITLGQPSGRIVGGEDASIDDYPHQISMLVYGSHSCGGTIMNERVIVTAAHCCQSRKPSDVVISVGGESLKKGGQKYAVKEIIVNENYNSWDISNDVALLITEEPIQFSESVQPIALAKEDPAAGSEVTITGWGTTREGGYLSDQLQKVNVNIVDKQSCANSYGASAITESMICAGVEKGGKDACQGDSGGPMIQGNTLVGIVSWGKGCARVNYPGVYTNVAAVRPWIVDNARSFM